SEPYYIAMRSRDSGVRRPTGAKGGKSRPGITARMKAAIRRSIKSAIRRREAVHSDLGANMPNSDGTHTAVRPRTAVLTRGFDPALSFGSARPAVFRSSTYVFANPEEAERAFSIMAGRVQAEDGERPDLIYSR